MVSKLKSFGIIGIEGYGVSVECDLSTGLPAFDIVGLPDASVKESRDRVRAAVKNCGFEFPLRRITVNLAPAERKKEGPLYDLPILLGILAASKQIPPLPEDCAFVGELSLEGALRPVSGMLSMACAAKEDASLRALFVPADNAKEASIVEGLEIFPAHTLSDIILHLKGDQKIEPAGKYICRNTGESGPDFADVMGQENVKRALEVAAAGGHNILLIGPPGSGKSMLARRLPSILPDLSNEEALETTKIHSVRGLIRKDAPLIRQRPFRSPHHTISPAGLSGGGQRMPRPGEISLAHNGVLFLDELPEFHKDVLEVLRQPIEEGVVTISRIGGTYSYPSRFMLVCAMNPCKCGYYGDSSGKCTCTKQAVQSYMGKVSGPMLDRIDIHVDVPAVRYESLRDRHPAEPSARIRGRVNRARKLQLERYRGTGVSCNACLKPSMMKAYCALDDEGNGMMKRAFSSLGLTARSYDRILKVARTIADL